jgi:hypothetical protein
MPEKPNLPSPFLQEFLDRVRQTAVPFIERATVLLVRFNGDTLKADRSGVFMRVGDDHFVITCSHSLKETIKKEIPLLMALPEGETPFVPLTDADFHGTETDSRDIGIVRLSREGVGQVLGRTPIELDNIAIGQSKRSGVFLLLGYPNEWFEVYANSLHHPPVAFLTAVYEPDAALIAELAADAKYGMPYDPNLHVMFTMTTTARRVSDWLELRLPDYLGMKGISGCGIWRLCDATPEAMRDWTPNQCKLVAIEHRYDAGNGFVHATWTDVALHRIATDYPAVANALGVYS